MFIGRDFMKPRYHCASVPQRFGKCCGNAPRPSFSLRIFCKALWNLVRALRGAPQVDRNQTQRSWHLILTFSEMPLCSKTKCYQIFSRSWKWIIPFDRNVRLGHLSSLIPHLSSSVQYSCHTSILQYRCFRVLGPRCQKTMWVLSRPILICSFWNFTQMLSSSTRSHSYL